MTVEFKDLESICEVIDPHPSHRAPKAQQEGIPFLGIGDFDSDGTLNFSNARVVDESVFDEHKNRYSLNDRLLVFGRVASIGKVIELPRKSEKFVISPTLAVLKPKGIDIKYLKYVLQSPDFMRQMDEMSTGSTRKSVGIKNLRKAKVPIFEESIQNQIVTTLEQSFSQIDEARVLAERNLINAKELFDSFLHEIFDGVNSGWPERRLCELYKIGSSKRIYESDWTNSGVPFYGGKEIVSLAKFGVAKSNAYISEEKYIEYSMKYDMPKPGDILMTARGTIGVGYIVQDNEKFYYKDGNIISFRSLVETNPNFVLYAFKSRHMLQQIEELNGTTVNHLPLNKAKELRIKIPDYKTQNVIVSKLDEFNLHIRSLEKVYSEKLVALGALKQSILRLAFSGELTKSKGVAV